MLVFGGVTPQKKTRNHTRKTGKFTVFLGPFWRLKFQRIIREKNYWPKSQARNCSLRGAHRRPHSPWFLARIQKAKIIIQKHTTPDVDFRHDEYPKSKITPQNATQGCNTGLLSLNKNGHPLAILQKLSAAICPPIHLVSGSFFAPKKKGSFSKNADMSESSQGDIF